MVIDKKYYLKNYGVCDVFWLEEKKCILEPQLVNGVFTSDKEVNIESDEIKSILKEEIISELKRLVYVGNVLKNEKLKTTEQIKFERAGNHIFNFITLDKKSDKYAFCLHLFNTTTVIDKWIEIEKLLENSDLLLYADRSYPELVKLYSSVNIHKNHIVDFLPPLKFLYKNEKYYLVDGINRFEMLNEYYSKTNENIRIPIIIIEE